MHRDWKAVAPVWSYHKFFGLILYLLLVNSLVAADMGPKGAVPENIKSPSTNHLLRLLIGAAAAKLDQKNEEKGCNSVMPGRRSITVGDYLAFLITQLEFPEKGFVSSRCRAQDAQGRQSCEVFFAVENAPDPWQYGMRFMLDRRGHLELKSIMCPGGS